MKFDYSSIIIITGLLLINSALSQNLLNGPEDIIFDNKHSRILVSNWASGAIVAIDSSFNQSYFKTGLSHAHGMELFGDTLFVASDSHIFGIHLANGQIQWQTDISGASRLGHITIDDSLNLYVSDWQIHKIFKVHIPTRVFSEIVSSGIDTPVGIMINGELSRLILCQFLNNTPLYSIDLYNYLLTPMSAGSFNQLDAIVRDTAGNFYISVWSTGEVIRFNSTFSNVPDVVSNGHNGPSGLGYDSETHVLGVTNYNSNSIDLIALSPTGLYENDYYAPLGFRLHQNYPNPFNPSTTIEFNLPKTSEVSLKVFNILGEEIATLLSASLHSGSHTAEWDAGHLASGVYLYRLEAEGFLQTRKMILMK